MVGKMANETCIFVPRPPGVTLVKSKLVPGLKFNLDGTIRERTMRWVGCGYSQVKGRDFDETYTATSKATSVRVFLCMTLNLGLKLRKTDVPKAFTKAKLDVKMYVEQPEATKLPGVLCSKVDKNGQPYVALLSKALEGLKQSGNLFQSLNTKVLKEELGFKQLEMEPTIFVKHTSTFLLMILVWIDDYAVAYSNVEALQWFLGSKTELNIKDEGDLRTFIGLEIDQTPNEITICQGTGIQRAIGRYFPQASGLPCAKLPAVYDSESRSSTLTDCGLLKDGESVPDDGPPYLSMVATALYFSVLSRPDTIYHSTFLARFSAAPNQACRAAILDLLGYLYHTRNDKITYNKKPSKVPKVIQEQNLIEHFLGNYGLYVTPDGSWKVKGDGTSLMYGGHIIFMCDAAVDWSCKLIKVICHSATEVELAAGCFAGKRAQFIRALLNDLYSLKVGNGLTGPIIFLIDNSAVGPLTKNLGVSKKTEHFLRWQLYLRWLVINKFAIVIWTPTKDEPGDICTKVLDAASFARHKKTIFNI
jgi:hypothetical protein